MKKCISFSSFECEAIETCIHNAEHTALILEDLCGYYGNASDNFDYRYLGIMSALQHIQSELAKTPFSFDKSVVSNSLKGGEFDD